NTGTAGTAQIFALGASRDLGDRIARSLGLALARCEEREFEDGEHKARSLDSVRARDVYVVHSLYSDDEQSANDKLCRLLFFLGSLRDAGAARVTALVPYLCYARKDRRTKARDPVTTRYVASMFEAVGVDALVTLEVHNPAAFDNAFRCATVHLQAYRLFASCLAPLLGSADVVVVSPDEGGMKRAEVFRQALARTLGRAVDLGFMEKTRSAGVVAGERLFAEVGGRSAVIFDDLISTGTTLLRAAQACRRAGARTVHAAATHGLFVGNAIRVLADPAIDRVIVADSVMPFRLAQEIGERKVTLIDTASLFADAIRFLRGEALATGSPDGLDSD
ncbi:MAG TPA: ribose-phosphate diphosphokinase, partial [Rudaea sp.]|nr:ribose-phosphate diphosphokinase [Rudaea sp.]